MSVGRLVVELIASVATFQSDLGKAAATAEQQARRIDRAFANVRAGISNRLAGVAAALGVTFSAAAFGRLISGTIEAAAHLEILAKQANISVEAMGGLGFAATQTGGDMDSMADAFKKFNQNISAAAAGSEREREVFKALGVSVKDLQTLKPDQIFIKAADAFASFEDSADKAALGAAAFGKGYQGILPTLDQGGALLQQNIDYFKRFGGVSEETARQSAAFETELKKVHLLSGAFARNLTEALLPQMRALANHFLEAKEKGDQFKETAQGVAAVVTNLAVGAAFVAHHFVGVGEAIGAAAARLDRWIHLDFKGASFIAADEEERVAKAGRDFDALIAKIRTAQRDQGAEGFAVGFGAEGGPKRPAPRLSVVGAAAARAAGEDPTKKILEGVLKALDDSIEEEKRILSARNEFLDAYYAHGDITLEEAFRIRNEAITEGVAFQKDAIDKEIAALVEFRESRRRILEAKEPRAPGFASAAKDIEDATNKITSATARRIQVEEDANRASTKGWFEQRIGAEAYAKAAFDATSDQLANQLAHINLLQESGSLTELEALAKSGDLIRAKITLLTQEIDKYAELAKREGDPVAAQIAQNNVDALRLRIEALNVQAGALGRKFEEIFTGAFANFLDDIVHRTKSVSQAFADMGRSIERSISKLIEEDLSKKLYRSLFGEGGMTGGVSPVDLLLKVLGLGGGATAVGSAGSGFVGADFSGFGAFASGTDYAPGGRALVGERGPEIVNLPRGSQVIPNSELVARRGARQVVNITTNFTLTGAVDRRTQDQIALGVAAAAQRALRRNG